MCLRNPGDSGGALPIAEMIYGDAIKQNVTVKRRKNAENGAHQGGFSTAVGPNQTTDGAGRNLK